MFLINYLIYIITQKKILSCCFFSIEKSIFTCYNHLFSSQGVIMGSCYKSQQFPVSSEKELMEAFRIHQKDLVDYYGNDPYSGQLTKCGLKVCNISFKTSSEANDYISERTNKYGDAYAVKVGDFSKAYPQTKKEIDTFAKLKEVQKQIVDFDKDLVIRVKSSKSLFKGCTHCGSKVAVKFIQNTHCPVCNRELIKTQTDHKKITSLFQKENSLKEEIKAQKEKYKNVVAYWLVGGWAAE